MTARIRSIFGILVAALLAGCTTSKPDSFSFLGVPEAESSDRGPGGLINGKPCQIKNVSPVSETSYQNYLSQKQAGRIFAEERRGDYVYYAVKEQRDVRFDNASAWVDVIERFKAKKP